jgi:biopolymer transport protein ExbD
MKLYSQHLSLHLHQAEPDANPMVEMNTTPLIDVLLVLLVMLIITIPVPLHSVNLDMPSRQATASVPEVVNLQMDAAGFVQWNDERVLDMTTLNARIATAAGGPVQPEIHLRPSADTPYTFVAAFLVLAQKAGLQKVGVVN